MTQHIENVRGPARDAARQRPGAGRPRAGAGGDGRGARRAPRRRRRRPRRRARRADRPAPRSRRRPDPRRGGRGERRRPRGASAARPRPRSALTASGSTPRSGTRRSPPRPPAWYGCASACRSWPTSDGDAAGRRPSSLDVERPAVGGRMIARHDGRVVFVAGAIPGERVEARVERVQRQLVVGRDDAGDHRLARSRARCRRASPAAARCWRTSATSGSGR